MGDQDCYCDCDFDDNRCDFIDICPGRETDTAMEAMALRLRTKEFSRKVAKGSMPKLKDLDPCARRNRFQSTYMRDYLHPDIAALYYGYQKKAAGIDTAPENYEECTCCNVEDNRSASCPPMTECGSDIGYGSGGCCRSPSPPRQQSPCQPMSYGRAYSPPRCPPRQCRSPVTNRGCAQSSCVPNNCTSRCNPPGCCEDEYCPPSGRTRYDERGNVCPTQDDCPAYARVGPMYIPLCPRPPRCPPKPCPPVICKPRKPYCAVNIDPCQPCYDVPESKQYPFEGSGIENDPSLRGGKRWGKNTTLIKPQIDRCYPTQYSGQNPCGGGNGTYRGESCPPPGCRRPYNAATSGGGCCNRSPSDRFNEKFLVNQKQVGMCPQGDNEERLISDVMRQLDCVEKDLTALQYCLDY